MTGKLEKAEDRDQKIGMKGGELFETLGDKNDTFQQKAEAETVGHPVEKDEVREIAKGKDKVTYLGNGTDVQHDPRGTRELHRFLILI